MIDILFYKKIVGANLPPGHAEIHLAEDPGLKRQ